MGQELGQGLWIRPGVESELRGWIQVWRVSLEVGPTQGEGYGTETEWWYLREMGKLVRGGEWVREVEVGLVGAVGRLDCLLPEAWLPLSSFLRSNPCRSSSGIGKGLPWEPAWSLPLLSGWSLKVPFLLRALVVLPVQRLD